MTGVTSGLEPFEALAESTTAIVFVTDHQMRMLYANRQLEEQTGFTVAEFQFPQEENPFIHREDAEHVGRALVAFLASDAAVAEPIENRFLDRWGRTHRYRTTVSKIRYQDADRLLFVCNSLQTRPASDTDVQQYRALVESTEDGIARVDNAGRFLYANHRTHALLGYTPIELGRLRLDDVVAVTEREALTEHFTRAVAAHGPFRFPLRLVAKGGTAITTSATLTPLGKFGIPGELLVILRVGRGPSPSAPHG